MNHWAFLKQKKILAIDKFSQPEVILEGLYCFVKSHTLWPEQGEQNNKKKKKKKFQDVDCFALTGISGSQILL